MRETCELRIDEAFAGLLFGPDDGKRISSSVRKVELGTDDPKFAAAGRLQRELIETKGKAFFYGWRIRRHYTDVEYQAAQLFRLRSFAVFEPAGEEYGTKYDESTACAKCGAGANQISDLFLPWNRIPKGKHFAKTIAGEIVVSRRVVELFRKHAITGAVFRDVRARPSSSAVSKEWFQLIPQVSNIEVISPTKTGNGPFDQDPNDECRCSRGDLIGLNLLSEVWIDSHYSTADIVASKQFVGCRRGLLRPERMYFIAPKLWRLLNDEKLKGVKFEIAHVN
jgi:hypothetical protein